MAMNSGICLSKISADRGKSVRKARPPGGLDRFRWMAALTSLQHKKTGAEVAPVFF